MSKKPKDAVSKKATKKIPTPAQVADEIVKEVKAKNNKKESKEILTIANLFQKFCLKGVKTRKLLAEKIVSYLAEKGIKKNVRGHPIVEAKVLQQISSMIRDINSERGKSAGSWWSKYKVTETKELLKIELKY